MNVDRIYTRGVIRIPRSATVTEAAQSMSRNRVGLLLVTGDGPNEYQAIGTVTDRDLVINALAEAANPDTTKVGEVMTHRLESVAADADIHEALMSMRQEQCRRLAVTDKEGRIVGVLSVDDLVDGIAADLSGLAQIMRAAGGPPIAPAAA